MMIAPWTLLAEATSTVPPQDTGFLATLVLVLLAAAFTDNILLTRFLGMCPFLSISRELKSAAGMGVAVTFVATITCTINSWLYYYVLVPLEAEWGVPIPAESLKLILFIIVIAATVQLLEMIIERISMRLYFALGVFLPLITVNCAILGCSLFMVNKDMSGWKAPVYGFGCGLGWCLAIILMAGIRQRLKKANVPAGLEGVGISLIVTGIMALCFIIFQGMIKVDV